MLTLETIRMKLHERLPGLKKKYPIAQVGLFGSVARGDFKPGESDIDILVELNGEMGWNYFDLCFELKELFPGEKVDVVARGAIQPHYWPFIQKDLTYV